jgi:O-antigen ligase
MKIAVPAAVALVAGIITPGLLFHFDVTPKIGILLVALTLILLFSAPQRFRDVKNLCGTRLGLGFVVLLGFTVLWLALATILSTNWQLSLTGSLWRRLGLLTTAAVLIFCVLSTAWFAHGQMRIRWFLRVLTLTAAVLSIYGICQYFGFDPLQPAGAYEAGEGPFTIVRTPGTLGHADYFASWLVPVFFLSLASAETESTRGQKIATYFAAALSLAAILLSGTRGALLGVAAGLIVLAVYRGIRFSWRAIAVTIAALALCVAFLASPAGAKLRARAHWSSEDALGGARLLLWRDTMRMGLERPLWGYGPEAFTTEFPRHESLDLARAYPDFYHESPHNIFLDAFIAGGLPCAMALIGCIGVALYAGRRSAPPPLLAAVSGLLVAQQFCVFVAATALLFYVLLGLLVVNQSETAETRLAAAHLPAFAVGIAASVVLVFYGARLIHADWTLARVQDRLRAGDVDGAVNWHTPGDGELYYSREMFRLARTSPKLGARVMAMRQALDAGRDATRTAEDRQNAWYQLAMLDASQNDSAAVERDLRQAIAAAPNWFKPHWALAQLLDRSNRLEEALAEAKAAVDRDGRKDPEVLLTFTKLLQRTHPAADSAF